MKFKNLGKALLSTIIFVGGVSIAVTAPNLFLIFKPYLGNKRKTNQQIKKSLFSLSKNKLIKIKIKGKNAHISGTNEGVKLLKYSEIDNFKKTTHINDGYIRLIIYDIPVSRNSVRREFLRKLKLLQFEYVQKSVWLSKQFCDHELETIFDVLNIKKNVKLYKIKLD